MKDKVQQFSQHAFKYGQNSVYLELNIDFRWAEAHTYTHKTSPKAEATTDTNEGSGLPHYTSL